MSSGKTMMAAALQKAPPAVETVVADLMKKSGSFNNALGVNRYSQSFNKLNN